MKSADENPIRILCVEDHPVFRDGLEMIIASEPDMVMVAYAGDSTAALAQYKQHRPHVTLLDLRLPGKDGVETLRDIRKHDTNARVMMLTTSDGDADIHRAMRWGASAYALKSMPQSELLAMIRSVHQGRRHIPPAVAARIAEHLGDDPLTDRELDVLRLIRDGNRNKEIAAELSIALTTVNFHIKNLVDKLQANDRTHAVTIAVRRGFLPM